MEESNEKEELGRLCREFLYRLEQESYEEFIHYMLFSEKNIVYLISAEESDIMVKMVCVDDEEAKSVYKVVNGILDEIRMETFDA